MFKEVGTLAEIGAKVGDVVELMEKDTFRPYGCTYTIKEGQPVGIYAQHDDGGVVLFGSDWSFRIVSRANPGPVITETVTLKRIVPGLYGKVSVGDSHSDAGVFISMSDRMSRADLIAARDVFNQLIDAMEE